MHPYASKLLKLGDTMHYDSAIPGIRTPGHPSNSATCNAYKVKTGININTKG